MTHTYPSLHGLFTITGHKNGFTLENNKTKEQYFFSDGFAMTRFLLCYYSNPIAAMFAYEVQQAEYEADRLAQEIDEYELAYIQAINETDNVIRDIFKS